MAQGTRYGDVTVGYSSRSVVIEAQGWQLYAWAHRTGAVWPCSVLAQCEDGIRAEFTPDGDLVDLTHAGVEDIPADEFNAWASDVLAAAGVAPEIAARVAGSVA